ncbi:MAG: DUF4124 domain-containing protein [Candidatus Rariloculaceae bacterium]
MYKWLILLSLLCPVCYGQTAYTWTDEMGQTHYSDRPIPGSTVVELETAQGFTAPQPAPDAAAEAEESNPADSYSAFNIVQPTHQETLWNIAGIINVTLEIEPDVQTGHRVGVYMDGAMVDVTTTGEQLVLTDVVRGQHTLQAVLLDADGGEVLRSLAVTFMVQQTSLLNPNNPNVR